MAALDGVDFTDVRMPGGMAPRLVCFNFTTNGTGVLTVDSSSDPTGLILVTRSGNNYIVTVGPYKRCIFGIMVASGLNTGRVDAPNNSTVQFNYGSSQNNVATGYCFMIFDA